MNGLISTYSIAADAAEQANRGRNFPAAITLFPNAIRMAKPNSELVRAKQGLGHAYRMTNQLELAQAELDEALDLGCCSNRDETRTLRLLAELTFDQALALPTTKGSQDKREELLDQAEVYARDSRLANLEEPDSNTLTEQSAMHSVLGAIYCERGDREVGLSLLREAILEFGPHDNLVYLINNNLRLMKYSPIDRRTSFWGILRLTSQKTPGHIYDDHVYRRLALRALFGLTVKL